MVVVDTKEFGLFWAMFGTTPLLYCAPGADGAAPNTATPRSQKSGAEGATGHFHGVAKIQLHELREVRNFGADERGSEQALSVLLLFPRSAILPLDSQSGLCIVLKVIFSQIESSVPC